MGRVAVTLIAITAVLGAQAPAPAKVDPFEPLRFLVGEWEGEGAGSPGSTAGAASFRFELDGKVLVRRSFAELPASAGRPASRHEDLLVIHPEGGALKALYLDNEGHTIHYVVQALAGAEGAVFLSEGTGPRFRMTYRRSGPDTAAFRFEMAPPQKPEAFSTYLEALTRRKATAQSKP